MELVLSTPESIKEIVDISVSEALKKFEKSFYQASVRDKKYKVGEAAKILRCSKKTIYLRIKRGDYKAYKMGRDYLISHSELFNSSNEVKSLNYKRAI